MQEEFIKQLRADFTQRCLQREYSFEGDLGQIYGLKFYRIANLADAAGDVHPETDKCEDSNETTVERASTTLSQVGERPREPSSNGYRVMRKGEVGEGQKIEISAQRHS